MTYRAQDATDALVPTQNDSPSGRFELLELKVISLAEADPVASIGAPSRFAARFERWFGFERPRPLADSRLEALRRFAVLARITGGELPGEEIKQFLAAGFTRLQARTLQRRAALSSR
jgi:hypothetical protein